MQNEREIDLPDLIYYILTKWKMLVLAGVIGLVLIGGYKFYSAEKVRIASLTEETIQTDSKEVIDLKKKLLDLTGQRAALEQQIERNSFSQMGRELAGEKAAQLQNYLSESTLMRINTGAAPKASKTYQVSLNSLLSLDPAFARDPVDELLSAYAAKITLDESIGGKYSIPAKYLNELISVTMDETANTVTVTAYGNDLDMAESLLTDACNMLEAREDDITDRYQKHELTAVSTVSGEAVDTDLAALQSLRYDELNEYIAQSRGIIFAGSSSASMDELNSKLAMVDLDIVSAEKAVTEAEEKTDSGLRTKKTSIKKGIKFGIIGGVAFAILLAGIYFLIYVFDGKLHTVTELGYCFGMPLLAGLSAAFKGCALDKCFYRLRNKGVGTSNEVVLQTASVTISKLLGEAKTVAVISSLDQEALEPVTSGLAKFIPEASFVSVADTNQTVEAAEKLKAVDAVIVYEKREASRIREIEAELHQARLLEKNIIGCIVG